LSSPKSKIETMFGMVQAPPPLATKRAMMTGASSDASWSARIVFSATTRLIAGSYAS
jgi:hypothetical protein